MWSNIGPNRYSIYFKGKMIPLSRRNTENNSEIIGITREPSWVISVQQSQRELTDHSFSLYILLQV